MTAQRIGIERGCLRDGIIVSRGAYGGQGLDHQPGGIVRILEGETAVLSVGRDEGGKVDVRRTRLVLGDGNGDGDLLRAGQDGQIVLLAIGEALAADGHLADKQ